MNDNEENDNTVEVIERLIQGEQKYIEWLTDSNNECRHLQHKHSKWWLYFQSICASVILIAELFDNSAPAISIIYILSTGCFCYCMIKNTESLWDNIIIEGENSILSTMKRKEEWEDFLREYRGY